MVQLKQVSIRLKSINNISKITKTMKMVSASKFTRAERELKAARPFGYAPRKFYESSRLLEPEKKPEKGKESAPPPPPPPPEAAAAEGKEGGKVKRVYIAMTSDRGLCGGVHSGVARRIRRELTPRAADVENNRVVCVGDKSNNMLKRNFQANMLLNMKDIGRTSPTFLDAAIIAAAVSDSGFKYDMGEIFYNKYYTPVKYELNVLPFYTKNKIEAAPNIHAFEDVDEDVLVSYSEWTLTALLYYALKEGAASEQSARMSAMDNATKNAGEMIRKLRLLFNRTRQAVITRELIEIISGASALKKE